MTEPRWYWRSRATVWPVWPVAGEPTMNSWPTRSARLMRARTAVELREAGADGVPGSAQVTPWAHVTDLAAAKRWAKPVGRRATTNVGTAAQVRTVGLRAQSRHS